MKNYIITVNGKQYEVSVEEGNNIKSIVENKIVGNTMSESKLERKESIKENTKASQAQIGNIEIKAPMAGKILDIKVAVGQKVKKGEVLLILEAMKMENEIVAPQDATVVSVNVNNSDMVEISKLLLSLE